MDKTLYKDVYVFAEQREGVIQPVALELLGKAHDLAAALNEKVVAILAGSGIESKAQSLIEAGADKVIVVDEPELKEYLTEQYSQVVSQVINANNPNIVLFGATLRRSWPQGFVRDSRPIVPSLKFQRRQGIS